MQERERAVFLHVYSRFSGSGTFIMTDLCKGTCIFYQNGGRCGTALCSADVDP